MGHIKEFEIVLPPPGGYGFDRVNVEAAHKNGLNDEAVDVLRHLPYISDSAEDVWLNFESYPHNYLDDNSGDAFQHASDPRSVGQRMLLYTVVLNYAALYGATLIYNTRTQHLTEWTYNDDDDWTRLASYAVDDAQNPLTKLILAFLHLKTLPMVRHLVFVDESSSVPSEEEERDPRMRALAEHDINQSVAKLYREAGWNMEGAQEVMEDETLGPVWERVEAARCVANATFDRQHFARIWADWVAAREARFGPEPFLGTYPTTN